MDEQIETLANEIELTKEYQRIATGGSLSFNGVIGYLELWAKYNSNDSGTNETNYSTQLRLVVSGGYIGNYATTTCALTATGITSSPVDLGGDSYTSRTLRTITGTIKHNADGTKVVDMAGSINFSAWGMTLSVSGSAKLPDLHTPPSINSVDVTETNSILINAGISNDTFVRWLSNKSFAFSTTTYDEADVVEYEVANVGISLDKSNASPVSINFANINLYGNEPNRLTAFEFYIKDSKNGVASLSNEYTFIPYFKPTFVNTETKVRRQGQTSGKVVLNASGNFYNTAIGSLSPSCKVYFKYWVKTEQEPNSYSEVPSTSVIINDNAFTINDYLLGNDFDYQKSYYVKVYVQDGFYSSEVLSLNVPVGEATWTEYKDRVDFKKATIQGIEVATKADLINIYSTEEIKTNKTRLGKPIYSKAVTINVGVGTSISTTSIEIDNVDLYTSINGTILRPNKSNWLVPGTNNVNIYQPNGTRYITVDFSSAVSDISTMEFTLEYTKTTD